MKTGILIAAVVFVVKLGQTNAQMGQEVSCGDNEWLNNGVCVACRACEDDTYASSACTPTTDTVCSGWRFAKEAWQEGLTCHGSVQTRKFDATEQECQDWCDEQHAHFDLQDQLLEALHSCCDFHVHERLCRFHPNQWLSGTKPHEHMQVLGFSQWADPAIARKLLSEEEGPAEEPEPVPVLVCADATGEACQLPGISHVMGGSITINGCKCQLVRPERKRAD